jgi:hypothetical protein
LEHIPEEYKHAVGKGFKTLEVGNQDPDNIWEEISRVITEDAMKNIPKKRNNKGPKWLTERTLQIAEERRKAKQAGSRAELRRLNSEFQREARKDKERFIKEKCHDL